MIRVVIVGGGVSGLATAWFLTRRAPPDLELSVRVIEADAAPGGRVGSVVEDGFVFERGPLGFLGHAPDTRDLVDGVGLGEHRLESAAAARRRFILHDGRLHAVPTTAFGLLTTELLSWRGRLRLLKEPFVGPPTDHDESVAAFAARRCGPEVVGSVAEPWVAGAWAGDAARLSLKCAFPKLALVERERRSLVRGAIAARGAKRGGGARFPSPGFGSFVGGMGELPAAVARDLGDAVYAGCRVATLARDFASYAVEIEGARTETLRADIVVLATPAEAAWELLDPIDPDLGATLRTIPHAPLAFVSAAWPRDAVPHRLDGIGFSCARTERRRILGGLFSSSLFPSHAPEGTVQLRAVLGGVFAPGILDQEDATLTATAVDELTDVLGITDSPTRAVVFRHPRGAPQYNLGHVSRLGMIDGKLREHPNLFLTGAAYRGISVDDCIRNGRKTASHVLRHLLTKD